MNNKKYTKRNSFVVYKLWGEHVQVPYVGTREGASQKQRDLQWQGSGLGYSDVKVVQADNIGVAIHKYIFE